MTDLDLQLLLLQGTITYTGNSRGGTSTIDLTMVLSRLFLERIICQTYLTKQGLDHLVVVSEFITKVPGVILPPRKAYINAKWDELNTEVKN